MDKGSRAGQWSSKTTGNALAVLKARLDASITGQNHNVYGADTFKLACGCWTTIVESQLDQMSEEAVKDAICFQCRGRLLTTDDDQEIEVRQNLIERQDWTDRQTSWEELDHIIHPARLIFGPFGFDLLLQALEVAVESLCVPESAVPVLLAIAKCEEAMLARLAVKSWVQTSSNVPYWSSGTAGQLKVAVLSALQHTARADTTLTSIPTPFGWQSFLDTWLQRAINFFMHRKCEKMGHRDRGVHWHDNDGHVYYAADPADVIIL